MKYECPSCFLQWKDEKEPFNNLFHPLCTFCSLRHSQKELLNWQMDHIENINPKKLIYLLRYFYRFVELEIKLLKEKLHDQRKEHTSKNGGKS